EAVLVEQAAPAVAVIRANLDALDLNDRVKVRRTRAETYLRTQRDGPFDLVLLDPPYAAPVGLVAGLLGRLARTALAPGAVVVVEAAAPPAAPPPPPRPPPPPPPAATATPPCTSPHKYPCPSRTEPGDHPCGPLAAQAPTTRSPTATSTSSPGPPDASTGSSWPC